MQLKPTPRIIPEIPQCLREIISEVFSSPCSNNSCRIVARCSSSSLDFSSFRRYSALRRASSCNSRSFLLRSSSSLRCARYARFAFISCTLKYASSGAGELQIWQIASSMFVWTAVDLSFRKVHAKQFHWGFRRCILDFFPSKCYGLGVSPSSICSSSLLESISSSSSSKSRSSISSSNKFCSSFPSTSITDEGSCYFI